MSEFSGSSERDLNPYTTFLNHLFVYPLSLAFESQKIFSRARNIAVTVEVRTSDDLEAKPLEVLRVIPAIELLLKVFLLVHLPSAGQ